MMLRNSFPATYLKGSYQGSVFPMELVGAMSGCMALNPAKKYWSQSNLKSKP